MCLLAVCLSVLVGANDVTMTRHCRAGVLLKLMDECAGIVAAKHCQTNVVTACLNATNFYQTIPIGTYLFNLLSFHNPSQCAPSFVIVFQPFVVC